MFKKIFKAIKEGFYKIGEAVANVWDKISGWLQKDNNEETLLDITTILATIATVATAVRIFIPVTIASASEPAIKVAVPASVLFAAARKGVEET